jgi:hypothetical protein
VLNRFFNQFVLGMFDLGNENKEFPTSMLVL